MIYKVHEKTSIFELGEILHKCIHMQDKIVCENDKVFYAVLKFIDDNCYSLKSKVYTQDELPK